MKTRNKLSAIVWSFCVLLVSGCERGFVTDENFPGVGSGELIPISVQVDGIEDFYGGAVTRGGVTKESFRQALDTLKDSGYDVVTTYETVQPEPSVQTRATLANVSFRLLAYKNSISTANYAGQCDYLTNGSGVAAAQTPSLKVPPGKYVFVCYSYGTNAALAAFNGASESRLSIQSGQDFMTWKSAVISVIPDITKGQYSLSGITFTRQCSQLEICVEASGFPKSNNVTSCAANVYGLSNSPSTWVIGDSDISTSGTSGIVSITWPGINSPTVYSNKAIILPASNRTVSVGLTTFRANNNTNYDNKVLATTAERQFVKGGYYRITLKVESNSLPACGYSWARANLKSSGVFESSYSAYGGYFCWNTVSTGIQDQNTGVYSAENDPCYHVAPKGTWYTPSSSQLSNLIGCGKGKWALGWFFPNASMIWQACGLRNGLGDYSNRGTVGYYWSRTVVKGQENVYIVKFSETMEIKIDDISRGFMVSVRCVKGK